MPLKIWYMHITILIPNGCSVQNLIIRLTLMTKIQKKIQKTSIYFFKSIHLFITLRSFKSLLVLFERPQ
jgi:hypothetical protein